MHAVSCNGEVCPIILEITIIVLQSEWFWRLCIGSISGEGPHQDDLHPTILFRALDRINSAEPGGEEEVCPMSTDFLSVPALWRGWRFSNKFTRLSGFWGLLTGKSLGGYTILKKELMPLVAFHPRPQIASDLGRNITCSLNPHRNRNQFPSGNEILAYGRRFKSQPASTRCDLRIASPTRPFLQVI